MPLLRTRLLFSGIGNILDSDDMTQVPQIEGLSISRFGIASAIQCGVRHCGSVAKIILSRERSLILFLYAVTPNRLATNFACPATL